MSPETTIVGSVLSIQRYPVKSMQGEEIDGVEVTERATIGTGVQLQIIDPCPRCVITTLPQGDLPHDTGILRTIAQHNQIESFTLTPGKILPAIAGVYATVVHEGRICQGDFIGLQCEFH